MMRRLFININAFTIKNILWVVNHNLKPYCGYAVWLLFLSLGCLVVCVDALRRVAGGFFGPLNEECQNRRAESTALPRTPLPLVALSGKTAKCYCHIFSHSSFYTRGAPQPQQPRCSSLSEIFIHQKING